MLLLCTPNSLYSRIVRVVASELNIDLPIEFVRVRTSASKLLDFNPAGKVPTLILDEGSVLAESRAICEHLQTHSKRKLLAEIFDHGAREVEGIVCGFVDGVAVWVREARRDPEEQSPPILELESARAYRCLRYFEIRDLSKAPLNYAYISLFCAIDLMSLRVEQSWRCDFPILARWYSDLAEKEVFVSTRPEIVAG